MSSKIEFFPLSGAQAFYNRPDYETVLREELSMTTPTTSYVSNHPANTPTAPPSSFISSIIQRVKSAIGHCFVPAALIPRVWLDQSRKELVDDKELRYKRFGIQCGEETIDVLIAGTPATFAKKRWAIFTGGCTEAYESSAFVLKDLLRNLGCNGLFFNYPGIGGSTGLLSRENIARSFRAVLDCVEDPRTINAREIILYGFSMGAAAQAEGLREHVLKPTIKYLAIKDRTFSRLDQLVEKILSKPFGNIVRWSEWDMDVVECSKNLQMPELIFQHAPRSKLAARMETDTYPEAQLGEENLFSWDGLICQQASLAGRLYPLTNTETNVAAATAPSVHSVAMKRFFYMREDHFGRAQHPEVIAKIALAELDQQSVNAQQP